MNVLFSAWSTKVFFFPGKAGLKMMPLNERLFHVQFTVLLRNFQSNRLMNLRQETFCGVGKVVAGVAVQHTDILTSEGRWSGLNTCSLFYTYL